jgi:hypothetical protein
MGAIARGLDDHASVAFDRGAHERIVARQRGPHGLLLPLPELGAALDVGEQKRDGTAGWPLRGCIARCHRERIRQLSVVRCGRRQLIGSKLAAGARQKGRAFSRRDAQMLGQQLGNLAGRVALVGLDLLDRHLSYADPPCKFGLGQVERLAPPPHPVAERGR